ncbi:MAG: protein-glutamate O-methyltransferase [Verrucomicrobia bacterium]|jgi:chemotaxis protein methyltransferase CheR|nr:protein-glutamate O-methyltransferase [Verrucomicrobiota bacterium]
MRDSEFDFIRELVYEHSRISLGRDKRELVSARLGKRLRATNAPDVASYCRLLQSPNAGDELGHLIDAISTNHTFFFRENAHFDFLRATIVPEMTARARSERWTRFNVWSAACSSGEEPYSIAMTLAAALPSSPWHIAATDISRRILARATAAIYPADSVERLAPEVIRTYFQRGFGPQEGLYRIKQELRQNVSFQHLNLLEGEPPFREPFQVIFCRNVMIYFDRATQEELISRLSRHLVPGGYLLVGHSESLSHIRHALRMLRPATYQKPFAS